MSQSESSLDTIIKFGKYKPQNFTLFDLIEHDIDYVKWLVENTNFKMTNEAFEHYKNKLEET